MTTLHTISTSKSMIIYIYTCFLWNFSGSLPDLPGFSRTKNLFFLRTVRRIRNDSQQAQEVMSLYRPKSRRPRSETSHMSKTIFKKKNSKEQVYKSVSYSKTIKTSYPVLPFKKKGKSLNKTKDTFQNQHLPKKKQRRWQPPRSLPPSPSPAIRSKEASWIKTVLHTKSSLISRIVLPS